MTGPYKWRQWGGGRTSCRESKMCACTRAAKIELPDFQWTPADLGWLKISWCSRDVGWACLRGLQELMLHWLIWYLRLPVGLNTCNSQRERADQEASQTRSHTRLRLLTWQQEEEEEDKTLPPGQWNIENFELWQQKGISHAKHITTGPTRKWCWHKQWNHYYRREVCGLVVWLNHLVCAVEVGLYCLKSFKTILMSVVSHTF